MFKDIERSSDGVKFLTIGTVKGSGTISEHVNYSFSDFDPNKGANYYRLRQIDFDGAMGQIHDGECGQTGFVY